MIKTLELEHGQKRLVKLLIKNITNSFEETLNDIIKSVDKAKDILKVPSTELHKGTVEIVT